MSSARIFDLGYRRYDGPRLGPSAAVKSLTWHTFGALIGRRRSIWAKLLTVFIAGIAYAPAVVFVGLAIFLPAQVQDAFLPGSSEYLGIVSMPVTLFVVLGTPLALCPDRRSGVLALYLASPLNRDTYLVAKYAATIGFLTIVTVGPGLFLLVGLSLLSQGPDGVLGWAAELARVVGGGLTFSMIFGSLGLALSSVTDRRTAAAAGVAMWLIGSSIVFRVVLIETMNRTETLALLDPSAVANEVVRRYYGTVGELPDVATWSVVAAAAAWIVGTVAFTRWRYHRLQVTR